MANDKQEQEELAKSPFSSVPMYDDSNADHFYNLDVENNSDIDQILEDDAEELQDDEEYFTESGADIPLNNIGADFNPVLGSATLGTLLRVVHTNGIHKIPIVSCQCQGEDNLPLDLFATHLIPASQKRIKTIFMAQVLHHY